MDQIPIIWLSYHKPEILSRGYWDQALLEHTFNKIGGFIHHDGFEDAELDKNAGAVVVINGRTHIDDHVQINKDIAKLRWCLFIITGDEEAVFPWRKIKHPIMKVWLMLPRANQHDDAHFKMANGYRPETRDILRELGEQERIYDYSFVGQVTHERRQQCFDVAAQFAPLYKTYIVGTKSFGADDVRYSAYLKIMAQSKIVLCPSGPENPDSFRVYEALEAGCLPVVDAFASNNQYFGFWQYLFGDDVPFPIVSYWDKLPDMLPQLLKDYPRNANRAFAWWQNYRRDLRHKLVDDIKELSK